MSGRGAFVWILMVFAVIFQIAVAPNIAIAQTAPNFLFLVVVIAALVDGPARGASMGFGLGLVFDLIGSGPVGPSALVFALVGFLAGSLQRNMFAENWLVPLTLFSVSTLLSQFIYGLVLKVLGTDISFWSSVFYRMIPATLYNTVIALLIFPWITRALKQGSRAMRVPNRF